MMRILLVEDEEELANALAAYLTRMNYVVDVVGSCEDARYALDSASYALAIMDRRLPDGDGLEVVRAARSSGQTMPVILLTAMDAVADRVAGLHDGADDYVVKPFDREELAARIIAALRRRGTTHVPPVSIGRLMFDSTFMSLCGPAGPIVLGRRELLLFAALVQRAGRVVFREALMEKVYGLDDIVRPATLETHVSRLRSRLATADAGVTIHTVRGLGYMIDEI